MDQSNTIHSFVAVIGDIKDSRLLENRKEVQTHMQTILEQVNEKYEEYIASRFLITLGDEFQGLLYTGENVLHIISEIRMQLYPVHLRFGIGFGQITTDIRAEMALGADGPGYYRAREAIERLKEREKKNRPVPAELCFKMGEQNRRTEIMLNTIFNQIYVIEKNWTKRQREIIWDMFLYEDGQQNTARRLNISQPTVQKALAAGGYYTYENALKNAAEILGEIEDE